MAQAWTEPGAVIAAASNTTAGYGTHIYNGDIVASLSGPVSQSKPLARPSGSGKTRPTTSQSIRRSHTAALLPEVNQTVLARITRLTPRSATCSILATYPPSQTAAPPTGTSRAPAAAANAAILPAPPRDVQPVAVPTTAQFSGQIRAQDVRATEKDKVVIGEAFRVGDVVRAVVISLGDQRDYYLSTAGNEFGVLLAWSEGDAFSGAGGGRLMEPVSWQEMRDPVTGKGERRKVAKTV